MKRVDIVLKALTPVAVGGRNSDPNYHLGMSSENDRFLIPASVIKGAIHERVRGMEHLLGAELALQITGKTQEKGEEKPSASAMHATDFSSDIPVSMGQPRNRIRMNRKTRTVEAGGLFSMMTAPAGSEFRGSLFFRSDVEEESVQKVIRALRGFPLVMGSGKTAGFGSMEVVRAERKAEESQELGVGFYRLILKPLTPFVVSPFGHETLEKKYFLPSLPTVSGRAIPATTPFSRSTPPLPSTGLPGVFSPSTLQKEKYGDENISFEVLREFVYGYEKLQPSLLQRKGKRLEPFGGFVELGPEGFAKRVPVQKVFSIHVQRNPRTKIVQTFWVQQAHKPVALSCLVSVDKSFTMDRILVLGGARGKGYGVMEVQSIAPYVDWESWKGRIESFSRFMEKELGNKGLFVPLLLTSPLLLGAGENLLEGFSRKFILGRTGSERYFDPGVQKVAVQEAFEPGSVVVVQTEYSMEKALETLKLAKTRGLGNGVENGWGDFEVYPMREGGDRE